MPKLKPETQIARRDAILDASELCFARSGFHRTTMQDICREAGISPGAFYVYFSSKEDLIAGICERDRAQFAERFENLAEATDILGALTRLAEVYLIEQGDHKQKLFVEIGAESTRNADVREMFAKVDQFVAASFTALIARFEAEGRVKLQHDAAVTARLILILGDGLFWRSGVMPDFELEETLPAVIATCGTLLGIEAVANPRLELQTTTANMEAVKS